MTAAGLVLPEIEQFRLGARLFKAKGKKTAAWKAFQTFLFNYSDSSLAADAQFMVAESIFAQAVADLQSGNAPDESQWRKKQTGLKAIGKGLKKSLDGLKYIGATVAGEEYTSKAEPDRIDNATFSEAITQYQKVVAGNRRSGLVETALFRIGECYYNIGDFPTALAHFRKLQKEYPHSYLVGEAILASAQCYLPGADYASAELEIKKLSTSYPSYQDDPRAQFISGIIRFQENKHDAALEPLDKLNSPEALFYSGQALLKSDKGIFATAKFKRVIEEHRDSKYAELSAFLIGESFFGSKNYAGAIQEFKRFLQVYPQSTLKEGALFKIAASYFLKKDYQAARENFNLLITTYPQGEFLSVSRYFIAESYRMAGQLKEASFSYGQMITSDPSSPIAGNASFMLGWVTYLQKNYTGALDEFQKYMDWHPFHPWAPQALVLMGNCYTKLGRSEDAALSYQQAFDRAPKTELAESAMALLNRARYQQGNYGQLTSGYTYILKSLPPSESKWRAISQLYLADSFYRQKLYREAISVYQSIMSLYPTQPAAIQARDGMSWCYFQLGDYEKSQSEREKIPDMKLPEGVSAPAMGSGAYELANALFNQKKYPEAVEQYEKFLAESSESPEAPEAVYRIGLCYYRQEYYSQAISTWETLEEKYPLHERTEEAVFQVADTYFRAQKYDKAIETYRKYIGKYPNKPRATEASLKIAQSMYNAGDDEKAIADFAAFLRKYPEDKRSLQTLDLLEASLDRWEAGKGGPGTRGRGITILKELVDSFPKTTLAAEAQFRVARRMFNWKEYENAVPEFETLILNYPDSAHIADAQFYNAESLYLLKRYSDATGLFQRFLQNFPQSEFAAAAYFHLATSYYNTQDYNGAIQAYQELIRKFPQSEFASAGLFNLGLSQKKLLKLNDAADTYMKLATAYPQDANATFALMEVAKIKKELNLNGEAVSILKDLGAKLPSGDEQKLEALFLTAEAYLANNEPEEAINALKAVGSTPPNNSIWKLEALRKLGEVYEKQERWLEAAEAYEQGGRISGDPKVAGSFRERAKYLRATYGNAPKKPAKTTGGGQ